MIAVLLVCKLRKTSGKVTPYERLSGENSTELKASFARFSSLNQFFFVFSVAQKLYLNKNIKCGDAYDRS